VAVPSAVVPSVGPLPTAQLIVYLQGPRVKAAIHDASEQFAVVVEGVEEVILHQRKPLECQMEKMTASSADSVDPSLAPLVRLLFVSVEAAPAVGGQVEEPNSVWCIVRRALVPRTCKDLEEAENESAVAVSHTQRLAEVHGSGGR